MAHQHIAVDGTKTWGQRVIRFRQSLLEVIQAGREIAGKANMCLDTVPDPDDYSHVGEVFGMTTADAQAFKAEHDSLMGKIDTDNAVDHVQTAVAQYANKIG